VGRSAHLPAPASYGWLWASCALNFGIKEGFKLRAVNLGGLPEQGRLYLESGRFVEFIGKLQAKNNNWPLSCSKPLTTPEYCLCWLILTPNCTVHCYLYQLNNKEREEEREVTSSRLHSDLSTG
jgi:hypothetical protein